MLLGLLTGSMNWSEWLHHAAWLRCISAKQLAAGTLLLAWQVRSKLVMQCDGMHSKAAAAGLLRCALLCSAAGVGHEYMGAAS
jgi:hypothetical protein